MNDSRNVLDEFKNVDHDLIIKTLDRRGIGLEIAIENTLRDFSMGSIVRSANAFGIRKVHVIGRKQWNKRGAMMTDKYLEVIYHQTIEMFKMSMVEQDRLVYALENNVDSENLVNVLLPDNLVLVFGQEGPGISGELLSVCDKVLHIDQLGSTRSLNVGVAAGIAMYEWVRQRV